MKFGLESWAFDLTTKSALRFDEYCQGAFKHTLSIYVALYIRPFDVNTFKIYPLKTKYDLEKIGQLLHIFKKYLKL